MAKTKWTFWPTQYFLCRTVIFIPTLLNITWNSSSYFAGVLPLFSYSVIVSYWHSFWFLFLCIVLKWVLYLNTSLCIIRTNQHIPPKNILLIFKFFSSYSSRFEKWTPINSRVIFCIFYIQSAITSWTICSRDISQIASLFLCGKAASSLFSITVTIISLQ